MKKYLFLIGLVVLFFISVHLLDIGDIISEDGSCYNIDLRDGGRVSFKEGGSMACNGFWCLEGTVLYHTSMYMMGVLFLVLVVAYLYEIRKNDKKK